MVKNISLLGSTGSIGVSALKVVRHSKGDFRVVALAANSNIDLLEVQAKEFLPDIVAVYDKEKALELSRRLPGVYVVGGAEGILEAATYEKAETVVSAIVGFAGLLPTLRAIEAGKNIALANKEVLVAAGEMVMDAVKRHNIALMPVDSEHSAIFQSMLGGNKKEVRRIILTASGGAFRNYTIEQLENVTVEDALSHPNWNMGAKITVDSSTLMNKGLELIEAYWLFGVSIDDIEVVIHPQSIVHSMVEFCDRSTLAQLSNPDMILPIQYALTYPERCDGFLKPLDFSKGINLDFYHPDTQRFVCLQIAYDAIKRGGSVPCYLNAANEVLVDRFLKHQISWMDIGRKLRLLVDSYQGVDALDLETIIDVDRQARFDAQKI